MANALTNLTHTILAQQALEAFTAALTPLNAFSRNFSPDAVNRGDKVKVFYASAADAAADFAGSYVMQDANAEGLDITIGTHKYVSWALTDKDLTNQPQLSLERFARQKGFQLAKAVFQDILSSVTAANFGAAGFTGAASTFDADDVADLEATCDSADWPEMERGLILAPTYHAAVVKDNAVQGTIGVDNSEVLKNSRVKRLHNFDVYKSNLIPANGENLKGFAVHPDAILVAMRSLATDTARAAAAGALYEVLTNESGMVIEFLDWYDVNTRTSKRVLQANYGYRVGNGAAISRIVSA